MNRPDLEAAVAAHPFLIGVSEHHIRLLADCAIRTHFEAGQVIFREGETANRFYLVEQGEVVLEAAGAGDKQVVIETIRDGESARLVVALSARTCGTSARGQRNQPARSFSTAQSCVSTCEKDHTLGFELFKRMGEVMTRRLQLARTRLLQAYSGTSGKEQEAK